MHKSKFFFRNKNLNDPSWELIWGITRGCRFDPGSGHSSSYFCKRNSLKHWHLRNCRANSLFNLKGLFSYSAMPVVPKSLNQIKWHCILIYLLPPSSYIKLGVLYLFFHGVLCYFVFQSLLLFIITGKQDFMRLKFGLLFFSTFFDFKGLKFDSSMGCSISSAFLSGNLPWL